MRQRFSRAVPGNDNRFVLYGWLALFDALTAINARDPRMLKTDLDVPAIAQYVAHRREALIYHNEPQLVS